METGRGATPKDFMATRKIWLPSQLAAIFLSETPRLGRMRIKHYCFSDTQLDTAAQVMARLARGVFFVGVDDKKESLRLPDVPRWNLGPVPCFAYTVHVPRKNVFR